MVGGDRVTKEIRLNYNSPAVCMRHLKVNKNAQGFSKILSVVWTIRHGPFDNYARNRG